MPEATETTCRDDRDRAVMAAANSRGGDWIVDVIEDTGEPIRVRARDLSSVATHNRMVGAVVATGRKHAAASGALRRAHKAWEAADE